MARRQFFEVFNDLHEAILRTTGKNMVFSDFVREASEEICEEVVGLKTADFLRANPDELRAGAQRFAFNWG